LDEINAEDKIRDEKIEIARTASLIDDDSSFMASVNEETELGAKVDASPKGSISLVPRPRQEAERKAPFPVEHKVSANHLLARLRSSLPTEHTNGSHSCSNRTDSETPGSLSNSKSDTEQTYVRMSAKVKDRISVVRKQTDMRADPQGPPLSSGGTSKQSHHGSVYSGRITSHRQETEESSSPVRPNIQSANYIDDVVCQDNWHENDNVAQLSEKEKDERVEKTISEKVADRILEMKLAAENHYGGLATYPKDAKGKTEPSRNPSARHLLLPGASPRQYAAGTCRPTATKSLLSADTYDWNAGLMSDDEHSDDFAAPVEHSPQDRPGQPTRLGDNFHPDSDHQEPWESSDIGYYRRFRDQQKEKLARTHQNDPIQQSWSLDASVPDGRQLRASQFSEQGINYPIPYTSNTKMQPDRSSASQKSHVSSRNPKLDNTFWKDEDVLSDLDTAAFEVYGSENDSLFGDLTCTSSGTPTSEISSKSSQPSHGRQETERESVCDDARATEQPPDSGYFSKHSRANWVRYGDSSNHSRAELSRYTDHSTSKYSKFSPFSKGDTMALTTYLEGDGQLLACVDKWLEEH
jgi:hypothetical protein